MPNISVLKNQRDNMSELLSKRMSKGMETDPGSPEILQELIDVSIHPQLLTKIKQPEASH